MLAEYEQSRQTAIRQRISDRNARFFEGEADNKLDGWADDLKLGLEREIKELDRLIEDFGTPKPEGLLRRTKAQRLHRFA